MNRIDRLMGIITQLQAKRHLSLSQIAKQFDISERTVFRDLKAIVLACSSLCVST
jgi:predicted DNA-binding transcriptional regulator YafY